ncbi:unnamed protein product [Lymnaea stagnalis]|uniref:UDP-glucuronosyltransferase n=1 Tax=Lymnaea stagnalis TaxID=6523 RepID=A0AAV2HEN1_LYMST
MRSTLALLTAAVLLHGVSPTQNGKTVVFLPIMIVSSHAMVYELVAQELALLGHHVHLAVPSAFARRLRTNSSSGVRYFSYGDFLDVSEDMFIKKCEETLGNATHGEPDWTWMLEYSSVLSDVFFQAMNERGLVEFVRELKPDLLVVDWSPRINELVAVPYALGVPFAVLSPLFSAATARVPSNPMEDAMNSKNFRSASSFYEKFLILLDVMYPFYYDLVYDTGYVARIAQDKPPITTSDLMSRAEIFLFENDHILDYPQPSLPNIKFLGGITPGPAKPLEEPFKTFMDTSRVGVAVVSFGSLVVNFPKNTTDKLVAVLKQLSLNVIWRANITTPDPDKILTSSWIPQNDLLGHRNTKLFISHCGTHGQYEALYHAVPVVCLPIFFDQSYNAERFEAKGFGLVGNLWTDSVETLVRVLQEATKSEEIKQSISKASEIYHQLFQDPKKEAAFWLDHVIKYGGAYMRSNTQKIPMYQYTLIYFLFLIAGMLLTLSLFMICVTICKVCLFLCSRNLKLKED